MGERKKRGRPAKGPTLPEEITVAVTQSGYPYILHNEDQDVSIGARVGLYRLVGSSKVVLEVEE
jgi:hypothetical protein